MIEYYAIKKLIRKYPIGCDSISGYDTIYVKFLKRLIHDLDKNNIKYNINDEIENMTVTSDAESYSELDEENIIHSNKMNVIDEEIILIAEKKKKRNAYLKYASKPHESINYFDILSTEIIEKIFNAIPKTAFIKSYGSMVQVSKRWNQILSDSNYWRVKLAKENFKEQTNTDPKTIYFDILKIKQNILQNAKCSQNMSNWVKSHDNNKYVQENIEKIFKNYYESLTYIHRDKKEKFGYRNNSWASVQTEYIKEKGVNKYFDFDIEYYIICKLKERSDYLPDYLINDSKSQNILVGLFYDMDNKKMQIIDLYMYNKELLSYLPILNAQILVTENYIGKYNSSVHLLDENKVLIYSYNYEKSSDIWCTFNHRIDIKNHFRYIIFDHKGKYNFRLTNTCIKIIF